MNVQSIIRIGILICFFVCSFIQTISGESINISEPPPFIVFAILGGFCFLTAPMICLVEMIFKKISINKGPWLKPSFGAPLFKNSSPVQFPWFCGLFCLFVSFGLFFGGLHRLNEYMAVICFSFVAGISFLLGVWFSLNIFKRSFTGPTNA